MCAATSGCTCGGRPPAIRTAGAEAGDAIAYFGTLQNDGPHGGPFRYRSILTDVLAWVIERAAGERLHELISRELWQPMGAEFDAEITVDRLGNPMADGGVSATLRDLARFGLLFLRRGRAGGRQVVPVVVDRRYGSRRAGRTASVRRG